jgi:hypothetical protein
MNFLLKEELSIRCYESFEILPFGSLLFTQEGWAVISSFFTHLWINP